ncbi:Hypothetical predicted protein [Pelobates cultripes]|uniref:Uncharacterized protein n=1 Tax=Pelobates cultripes TaxID=61616 RepID=A0AAD1TAV9_PELCU|nr:Hypothetical predicted protein [Pelobates cultripes]
MAALSGRHTKKRTYPPEVKAQTVKQDTSAGRPIRRPPPTRPAPERTGKRQDSEEHTRLPIKHDKIQQQHWKIQRDPRNNTQTHLALMPAQKDTCPLLTRHSRTGIG